MGLYASGRRLPVMGNIQFNDGKILFAGTKIAMDAACCCETPPDCFVCDPTDEVPSELTVTITGMGDVGDSCGECADLNGVYVLTPFNDPQAGLLACHWEYVLESTICGADRLHVHLTTSGPTTEAEFRGSTAYVWTETPNASPYDCLNLDVTWSDVSGGGGQCVMTGSTAHVQAL